MPEHKDDSDQLPQSVDSEYGAPIMRTPGVAIGNSSV